ncbi:hypothetical protein FRACYDRAFT_248195 [Fragilariopsis cylindrus CCMP1102]|uniref:Uncharacterized protein n=1 Tax=Fragilariopsis cylindrus CCMP1102 TaxID=635003 RepID=A0A1E7EWN4_9STRA|nr:hypothetical protein FRACYDRAFT_248195 [Fragilariopsis cylindrus CCMP1102]|eukprot:OEU09943.1 hypothetical protein FRACYDRAFT_248195 [Fragilariopsis cylindrus CCMP1102]
MHSRLLSSFHLLVSLSGLFYFLQDTSSAFSSSSNDRSSSTTSSRKVNVCETRKIPGVSITQAYQGFLDFTWKKGGGLPVLLIVDKDNPSKRNLFLLGEELGPVWKSEIEEGSHTGVVSFTSFEDEEEEGVNSNNDGYRHSSSGGAEMTWNVSFQTLNRNNLWQSVTESSISDACDNLVCYLSKPLLMTKRVSICRRRRQTQPQPQPQQLLNHKVLAKEWMGFIWRKGGGLPLPLPPIPLRSDWNDRMIVPPFLIERIVEINETSSDYTDIIYTVVNPSIVTYPVYTHLGRVRFQSSSLSGRYQQNDSTDSTGDSVMRDTEEDTETIEMIWQVSIRPLNNFILKKFVVFFTEIVVSVLARNFKRHIGDIGDDRMDEIDGTLSWGLGDLPDEV